MSEAMGSIDCPDCQYQLLQQQSQATAPDPSENQQVHQLSNDITQSGRNPSESVSMWSETRNKPASTLSQEMITGHYQLRNNVGNGSGMPNSSSSSSFYSYSTEAENFHFSSGGSNNTPSGSLQNTPVGLSSISQIGDMAQSSAPIEPCDYNGYCSTCAVLELPTNEKFYRPTNSRPHVFPPIFYAQGASSVIPCFSPIPDCPWSNEYNLYGYTAPYSQQTSNPSIPNEYYGSSNVISNSSAISSLDPPNNANSVQLNSTVPYSISSAYNSTNTRSECRMESGTDNNTESRQLSKPTLNPLRNPECSAGRVISIANQSPSSSEDDTDIDSSCGSDGSDSILSEDRELISVVEDDENDSTKELNTPFNAGRPNSKCWICHNPLDLAAVCTSPQLEKILEHIDGEITADDLDISVSSDYIEIGGIDDEVKDFNHKKEHTASQSDISISRLCTLIGISPQNFVDFESPKNQMPDSDAVCLCFKCGKLVALADHLERQLTLAVNKLHQQLLSKPSIQDLSSPVPQGRFFRVDGNIPYALNINRRPEFIDKSTQIDDLVTFDSIPIKGMEPLKQKFNNDVEQTVETKCVNTSKISPNNSSDEESSSDNDGTEDFTSEKVKVFLVSSPNNNLIMQTDPLCPNSSGNSTTNFTDCLQDSNPNPSKDEPNSCQSIETAERQDNYNFSIPTQSSIISNNENSETKTTSFDKISEPNQNCIQPVIKMTEDIFQNDIAVPNGNETQFSDNSSDPTFSNDTFIPQSVPKGLNNILIICNYCQRKFSTKSNLKAHIGICKFKTSHKQTDEMEVDKCNMKCLNCGIGFRSTIRRKMHIEHGCKTIIFECEYCLKRFSKNSELKVHLLLHQGGKSFKCSICGASFFTKGNQVAHSRIHSSKKSYPCTLCEKGFNRKYALLMHMNRHTGEKPFSCFACKKSFSDPSNLKNHTKRCFKEKDIVQTNIRI